MNTQQILQSDLLDIVFAGRNKEYGAYELRRSYNRRVVISLTGMAVLILLVYLIHSFAGTNEDAPLFRVMTIDETRVLNAPEEKKLQPLPQEPAKPKTQVVATVQYTRARISDDNEVLVPPPGVEEIEKAQISIKTQEGAPYEDIIAPPDEVPGTGVIAGPPSKMRDENDDIVINVDIQASFPGGEKAWLKYVRTAIERELGDFSEEDYGTCVVKFVVDKTGKVSDVQATTMKGTKLAEVAVNAIRKGPKWVPGQVNGRYVNAYRMQPVTLKKPD